MLDIPTFLSEKVNIIAMQYLDVLILFYVFAFGSFESLVCMMKGRGNVSRE